MSAVFLWAKLMFSRILSLAVYTNAFALNKVNCNYDPNFRYQQNKSK